MTQIRVHLRIGSRGDRLPWLIETTSLARGLAGAARQLTTYWPRRRKTGGIGTTELIGPLRVSLELRGRRDASTSEPAEALAGRPADIRRAVRRLDMLGLVGQLHARTTEQTPLAITPAGLAPVRALLAAVGHPAAAREAAKARVR
jgi:hypothetical protein